MKKLIIIAASALAFASAPAKAGLNSGDWANILGAVVEVAGAAATGYAAAQAVQQAQTPQPTVFYTGYYVDDAGHKVCKYTDGSEYVSPTLTDCPAWF